MTGTILITGANGSLAIPLVRHLLVNHPEHTLLLTVRNPADDSENSNRLRNTIKEYDSTSKKTRLQALDLANLQSVESFANKLASEIKDGQLPALSSIIANAFWWNLAQGLKLTTDGYEQTVQVNHISHAALTLKLLGSFQPTGGRIILFSSDAHWPGKNSLEKIPVSIPSNLDEIVKPPGGEDLMAHGFLQYARSKLVVTMWAYALIRRLESSKLNNVTVIALNPGNLSDSTALRKNTPPMVQFLSKWVIKPARPLLRFVDPTMRTALDAGIDVAELAVNKASPGSNGFFVMHKKDQSSPDSVNEQVQDALWEKTLVWTHVQESDIAFG